MCGIVGYVGQGQALPFLLAGLEKLEYRGYDSAGVAVMADRRVAVHKGEGRLARLVERLKIGGPTGSTGIGHTRWATHGRPSDENSHPHTDCHGRFVVIHNGIIENYLQYKEILQAHGHTFRSETDTEVIPHLIEANYHGDLVDAVRRVAHMLKGAYALAVMCTDEPDKIVAVRLASPLIIGLGEGENFLASDIPAILSRTRKALILSDGEMAVLTHANVELMDMEGNPITREPLVVTWDPGEAEKGGYAHFMLKEIHEQPRAVRDTLAGRISDDGQQVVFRELGISAQQVRNLRKVALVACGTAAHAGLVGKHLIEKLGGIPVEWDIASEYRYRDPAVDSQTLFVAISQSGETADTLAALRAAKGKGARTVTISNVVGSSIARESDHVLYTRAGPEIAVASTKAYTTQLVVLTLLAVWLGQQNGALAQAEATALLADLRKLPDHLSAVLGLESFIADLARDVIARQDDVFFIGRHLDYAVAMEGQLKLKEISYIHAEAYAAGELKHGPLALIMPDVPVIALATQEALRDKTISNIQEVRARGATVVAVTLVGDSEVPRHAHHVISVPRTNPLLTPALAVLPLQLIAYFAAVLRGHDVDKPRNLAKSVTVE